MNARWQAESRPPGHGKTVARWWMGAALVLSLLAACSSPPSPQRVQPLGEPGIPDHAPFADISCLKCHDRDRPAPVIDNSTGAPMIHGGGQDCGQCHVPGGQSWREFSSFSHSPTPGSCLDCHASARPAGIVNNTMAHAYPTVGDCVACHAGNAGASWVPATFTHDPSPASCAECHGGQRPVTVVQGFSHDAGGRGDCAACHHSPGVRWNDGFFSHDPAPARCSDCHAGDRPEGPVGDPPFDHGLAGMGDCKSCHQPLSATKADWTGGGFSHNPAPTACIDCHLPTRPVGPAGTSAFDHANGGTGDCVSCHLPKSTAQTDWSGGFFTHSPVPAACKDCHVNDRPVGPVGSPAFDHAVAGMGDCKSCHQPKSSLQTDWSGGAFAHSPAPATCIDCHLGQRPAVPTASGFDHAKGGTGDCAACHRNPGVSWAGAVAGYDHATMPFDTRCDSCHEGKRPAGALDVPWPGHPANPNLFVHSLLAATDCKGCHLDPGGAWSPGIYSHLPNPGQCSVCHLGQRPVGPAGNPLFDHALGGSGDCVSCHAVKSPTKADWTGGTFDHAGSLANCASCHEYQRPDDNLHNTKATGDCKSCHAPRSATQVDWTGGAFSHSPKPTTCAGCHSTDKPTSAVRGTGTSTDGRNYVNDYLHGLVAGDCAACHQVRSTTQVDWTGGRYSHSPVPGVCSTCHSVTRPAAGTVAFDHTLPGLGECSSCHAFPGQKWTGASAIPAVVVLTPPTGKNWGNITAAHPAIDPAKSGLTCATCHGSNTGAKIIAYDHAQPVAGSKCVYCHYTGQTETSATIKTKSHESTSNTKDCNVSGCHRPKSYPTWKASTRTFTGGEWGEP